MIQPVRAWPPASLLGRLAPQPLRALLEAGTELRYPPRKVLLRQGDEGSHAILLISGVAKVIVGTENGGEALLAIRAGGDLVGEMAPIDGATRSATVITGGHVCARHIRQAELMRLLRQWPDLAIELVRMVNERLRWADWCRLDFVTQGAPMRVARVLVELAETYGRRVPDGWDLGVELTRSEIASIAGVALATLEKALYSLDHGGLVRRARRRVVITDLARLREIAGMPSRYP